MFRARPFSFASISRVLHDLDQALLGVSNYPWAIVAYVLYVAALVAFGTAMLAYPNNDIPWTDVATFLSLPLFVAISLVARTMYHRYRLYHCPRVGS